MILPSPHHRVGQKFCGCRWHPDCVGPTPVEQIERILDNYNKIYMAWSGSNLSLLLTCEDTLMAIQMVVDKYNDS